MKKLKISLLALAATINVGAWAQEWTDVTSTYLTNADFSDPSTITNQSVNTYAKDGTNGQQVVAYWDGNDTSDGHAAGAFAIGSGYYLAGEDYIVPTTNPVDNKEGYVLGLAGCWGSSLSYSQNLKTKLPAGKYKFEIKGYNANSSATAFGTQTIGIKEANGNTHYVTATWTSKTWTTASVEFSITSAIDGMVIIGTNNIEGGSGSSAKVFFTDLKLYVDFDKSNLEALIQEANNLYNEDKNGAAELKSAFEAAQAIYNKEDATIEEMFGAEVTLQNAITAFQYAQATPENPIDFTSYLMNSGFEGSCSGNSGTVNIPQDWAIQHNLSGWLDGSINTTAPSEGNKCYNLWAGNITSIDMNQMVYLPAGKYELSADFRIDNLNLVTNQGVYASVDGNSFKSTETITKVASTWNSLEGWNKLSTIFNVYDDYSSVKIGASSTGSGSGSAGWFQIDNFTLKFIGNQDIIFKAVELANPCIAGKWYKTEITATGNYNISSSVDAIVYYTQNGEQPDENITNINLVAGTPQILNLTKGTIYLKVSAETIIEISPASYSYELGELACNHKVNGYIQDGAISITFPQAVTNDPNATLTFVENSKAIVNETEVALSAISSGFQFNIGELAKATTYNVVVPADVFGYSGHAMNEEIKLTFYTPEIFDGVYYVYNPLTKKFTSRGNAYNTAVTVDEYGIAMSLTTDEDNNTTFKLIDSGKEWGFDEWMFTDAGGNDVRKYNIYSTTDGYTIKNTTNGKNVYVYLLENGDKFRVAGNAIKNDNYSDDAQIVWQFMAPVDHVTVLNTYKDEQAKTAAEAADISDVTTKDNLETVVKEYKQTTIIIETPSNVEESYQFGKGKDVYTKSVSNLKPGLYKLTVEAFTRLSGFDATYTAKQGNYASTASYIYANDAKTQICSLVDDYSTTPSEGKWKEKDSKYYPDDMTSAGKAFDNGLYKNEIWVYVTADAGKETGTINYGIKEPGKCENGHWLCYRKFTLTHYSNVKSANMTIKENVKWGTFCAPFDVELDEGVKAYTADASGSNVAFTEVNGTIEAGTPVVVYKDVTETYTKDYSASVKDFNTTCSFGVLVGVYAATSGISAAANHTNYVLQNNAQGVGFYKVAEGTISLNANRCYMTLPTSYAAKDCVVLDGIVTGINNILNPTDKSAEGIYDLNGRKLAAPQKGINIINGVKVIVK